MKKLRRIVSQRVRATSRRMNRRARRASPARVLLLVEGAMLFALLVFFLTGSRAAAVDQYGRHADLALFAATLAFFGLLHVALVRRVSLVIKRRFMLDAYDERRILSDLGHAARGVNTIEQLFRMSVDTIQEALRTENVSIFVRDDESGDYVCQICWPQETTPGHERSVPPLVLSRNAFVVKRLKRLGIPLGVGPSDFETWTQALVTDTPAMREARLREIATLECIRSRLLLQVMMKDHLVGIISLGARPGNLPFSAEDKQMLMSVAGQMAFVIENAKLVGRMVEEEGLRRELSLATEVQRRLFPEHPPVRESLELSGFCQPARGVGGDYYDFLALDDGQIGIAVADVAGKGISAALLMSIVQASLRSQAVAARGSLSDLVSTMNRLMYSSTTEASYATFFYAQLDERSRRLTYVNAGHNPPFLMRAAPMEDDEAAPRVLLSCNRAAANGAGVAVLEAPVAPAADTVDARARLHAMLTSGGPVIGVFSDCVYEQETIQLERGDVLVAYTDGVTEALSEEGEEFGECRLERVLAAASHLSADEISSTIVERVRQWCGNAPQHDDLTFVVLKVK
ncbi:MAG: SpoIIE family protein phosphatase [Pyrinomonadaceae bacterium]